MNLWQAFNGEVNGRVFWPIILGMLCILIPMIMALR
jgi:hypothetical protein